MQSCISIDGSARENDVILWMFTKIIQISLYALTFETGVYIIVGYRIFERLQDSSCKQRFTE